MEKEYYSYVENWLCSVIVMRFALVFVLPLTYVSIGHYPSTIRKEIGRKQMTQAYKTCPQCDKPNALEAQVCQHCGYAFAPETSTQPSQGQAPYGSYAPAPPPPSYPPMPQQGGYPPMPQQGYAPMPQQGASNKVAAGICGILLGGLGIHKFILGMNTAGIIMLLVSLLSCGLLSPVMAIIGLVEGIIYLSKSDAEFYQTYVVEKKQWF
jgi:TM2 domain-containing membrane protein YozV